MVHLPPAGTSDSIPLPLRGPNGKERLTIACVCCLQAFMTYFEEFNRYSATFISSTLPKVFERTSALFLILTIH